jgi:hypothetical protein
MNDLSIVCGKYAGENQRDRQPSLISVELHAPLIEFLQMPVDFLHILGIIVFMPVIEKNIPMPDYHNIPIFMMDVGDSVAYKFHDLPDKTRFVTDLHCFARNHNFKIKTKTRLENGVKILRVWRVA